MAGAKQKAEEYLREGQKYRLGFLPTEQAHPLTRDLSQLAKSDLAKAYATLRKVDELALESLVNVSSTLVSLKEQIQATLQEGGRIFLVGCGATGRLSLALEYLWRRRAGVQTDLQDRVVGFMAGGDVALVHALEGFEDYPDYGARHLVSLGFTSKDLLIASTEGGETPFVIGAALEGARISSRPVFFAFCNPQELLKRIERSQQILSHPKVIALELFVGPMALSGSTRLQACTALMLAIGVCLLNWEDSRSPKQEIENFLALFRSTDFSAFRAFTESEASVYQKNGSILYDVDDLALSVFTDTTERAPTFNLPAFDNQTAPKVVPSLCYVRLPQAQTAMESWVRLLGHPPRCLDWSEINQKTTLQYLNGFDFGQGALGFREKLLKKKPDIFSVTRDGAQLCFHFLDFQLSVPVMGGSELFYHLLLKIMLNTHSTLLMGRLDRYVSNFMTWVYPTNGKLIDRASRYVLMWLDHNGVDDVRYEQVVHQIFAELETLTPQESIVLKAAQTILRNR